MTKKYSKGNLSFWMQRNVSFFSVQDSVFLNQAALQSLKTKLPYLHFRKRNSSLEQAVSELVQPMQIYSQRKICGPGNKSFDSNRKNIGKILFN